MAAIIRDTLWMAARYADERRSYAVGLYNDARVKAEALGCAHEAWPAVDGMDPERPTLTEELATLRAERDAAQQEAAKWKASGDVMEAEKVSAQERHQLAAGEQDPPRGAESRVVRVDSARRPAVGEDVGRASSCCRFVRLPAPTGATAMSRRWFLNGLFEAGCHQNGAFSTYHAMEAGLVLMVSA